MIETTLQNIIDKYLKDIIDKGLNKLPIKEIHPEMVDKKQDRSSQWKIWFSIDSKVTDSQIDTFEKSIGHKLPESYRSFLKYKHFYELYIDECSFCRNEPNTWTSSLTDLIFNSYPREFLIDKGYIPFAIWSDWGLLCFDTTKNSIDKNYPIVQWDHERHDQFLFYSKDFESLLIDLDIRATKTAS